MAYDQIRLMGMNEKVGLVSFPRAKENEFVGRPYSQQTTQLIDNVSDSCNSMIQLRPVNFSLVQIPLGSSHLEQYGSTR